ncbi:SsrA-binding protein SmpB [Patescibacteria group bacterium]|nr:SsrA-binding protein SmpB [Patescibacteria group bacterium]
MPQIYAKNKRARYDYEILETYEAGLMLTGQEVKSVRDKTVSLKGSFVTLKGNEAYLTNAHISPYKHAGKLKAYDPTRSRKLLLHKHELNSLIGKLKQKGLTLVPLLLYNKNSRIKLSFGLGKGKKKFDKRDSIKKRDVERKIQRMMRGKIS